MTANENILVVRLWFEIKGKDISEAPDAFLDLMHQIHSWTDTITEAQLHFLIPTLFRRKNSYHYFFGNLIHFGITAYAYFKNLNYDNILDPLINTLF